MLLVIDIIIVTSKFYLRSAFLSVSCREDERKTKDQIYLTYYTTFYLGEIEERVDLGENIPEYLNYGV